MKTHDNFILSHMARTGETPCPEHCRPLPCLRCHVEEQADIFEALPESTTPFFEPDCKEIARLLRRVSWRLSAQ
jgi:hypothetical protein